MNYTFISNEIGGIGQGLNYLFRIWDVRFRIFYRGLHRHFLRSFATSA